MKFHDWLFIIGILVLIVFGTYSSCSYNNDIEIDKGGNLEFTVTFYKRLGLLVSKNEVVVGTKEVLEAKKHFEGKKFYYESLAPKISRVFSTEHVCTISLSLAQELNKIHNNHFENKQDLRVKVKGSFNKYVYKDYYPGPKLIDHYKNLSAFGGHVNIRYKLDNGKILADWKKAGYPLVWEVE